MGRQGGRRKGERRRRSRLRRALRWLAFVPLASRVPTYGRLVWSLVRDDRIPATRKALLAGAFGYLVTRRDLVPDDWPIIGTIDDAAVVVLAVDLFLDGVPDEILDEKLDELGLDREAFRHDIAQVRRLTPGPLRRIIRRLPEALDAAGRLASRARLGPRLRAWINKEESFA